MIINKYSSNRYGTVYFVSPEVMQGWHNTDWLVWNIGVIAYLLLTGKQPFEAYGFKNYQDTVINNDIDLEIPEFDDASEEFMDLMEKMLNNDQFLRHSLIDCTHHDAILRQDHSSSGGVTDQEEVKKKLKIFQGEMQIYSGIVGMLYINWMYTPKRWNKRIKKSLEKVVGPDKMVPKNKLADAYKYFTVEPKILEFNVSILQTKLDSSKDSYTIEEIIEGMRKIDIEHYETKIKDSFRYFDSDKCIDSDSVLRVLKRTHPVKESKLLQSIEKNKNEDGFINYEALVKIFL